MTLNMFFTTYECSEVATVNMFLQDLTLMCIYQNSQYLLPQKKSYYCGFINHEFGLRNGLKVILKFLLIYSE